MKLSDAERRSYDEQGFLVREQVFTQTEVASMQEATEELCRDLAAAAGPNRIKVSAHYVFELNGLKDIVLKWEPGNEDVVQGVEPFAHLHPTFTDIARHEGFVEVCADILGVPEVGLFTEKLNVKRANVGGRYSLHQDIPYWRGVAEDADALVTAWVALDDSTAANGALEVLPGSHKHGQVPGKDSDLDFERNEIDESTFDTSKMVTVEVAAGSAIYFGPYLVHRSAPNLSDDDRRAVLYTYQAAGLRTQRENVHRWAVASGSAVTASVEGAQA